jgi:hypothetical protein
MLMGLQIFNTDHVAELGAQGFAVARIDLQTAGTDLVMQRIDELLRYDVRPLAILREVDQLDAVAEGVDVELGNEPDLEHEGWTPASYRERCLAFLERSRGRHRLWFGAVSNLNNRGFKFLEALPWADWAPEVHCSVHRYPEAHGGPTRGHDRRSRDEEVATLRGIVGDRPIGLSEIGYSSAWTETEQASCYSFERTFFSLHGFALAVAYQIASSSEDLYGFRRDDGTWKPCTAAWTGIEN